jgi:hypothetical protein
VEDALAFLASVDVDVESRRLARAIDAAFEATLATSDDERATHAAEALASLGERDRIESALAAIAEMLAAGRGADSGVRDRFDVVRAAVARLDRASRVAASPLVALNEERRRERDVLSGEHRTRAWWWSERAECDALAALLRGDSPDAEHLASCDECQRDRERMAIADAPPLKHLTADELWSWDIGAMTKDERLRAKRHAARCDECKLALDALADAENAIAGVSEPPPRDADDDAIAEHAAFIVRLRRDAKRVRVIVEPRGDVVLKSATLAGAGRARRTERGLELGIASSAARVERVALVVVLATGRVELEIDLARRR